MYLSFYHLKHKPFQISTDPRFLWLGEKHEEALATLRYGILDNKGFLLLTGDAGTGKTTLINTLLKTLGDNTLVALIRDPDLEPMDFYNYTAHAFGMVGHFTSKGSFLIQFEQFLLDTNSAKKKALLIIDEAQRINQGLLEEVRLLSNIEKEDRKLLNIFFVGQLEFNEILLRKENRAIRQRITVNYNIPALTRKETGQYINHRMTVAGEEKEYSFGYLPEKKQREPAKKGTNKIFSDGAIKEIYFFSKGYPRLINIICDRSLLTGFVEEAKIITVKHVKECVKELQIPELTFSKTDVQDVAQHREEITIAPVPPPESVPADHTPQEQKDEKRRTSAGKTAFATGALLVLVLGYFTLTENGRLQRDSVIEYVQSFQQPTGTMVRERELQPKNKIRLPEPRILPQPETLPQPEQAGKSSLQRSDHKEAVKIKDKTAPPKNEAKGVPGEDTDQKTKTAAAVSTDTEVHPPPLEPTRKKTKINQNPGTVSTIVKIRESKPAAQATGTGPSRPAKNSATEARPPADKKIQVQPLVSFKKLIIPFPTNTSLPSGSSLRELNKLVKSLLKQPFYKVFVTGFAYSQGDETANVRLSRFRARAVESYLVGRGLQESMIETRGLGSQNPIAPTNTAAEKMATSRVEVETPR